MAKNNHAISTRLMSASTTSRRSPLAERLNKQVLQTLRDLQTDIEKDPGIEDEYEFEIFGDTGPTPPKKRK
jgi:hypothetical protein